MVNFNDLGTLQDLAICFLIYSFLGWVIESIYISVFRKKMVNTGFLYGPFCPIYGFGAITIITFVNSFKGNCILTFFVAFVLLSALEYLVGVWLESTFQRRYWDYSNRKFNLKGYVCLQNSFYWGFLAVMLLEFINPFIYSKIDMIDVNTKWCICLIGYVYIFIDCKISSMKANSINMALEKLKMVSIMLDKRREDIKKLAEENSKKRKEYAESIMESLEKLQDSLIEDINKKTKHVNKAFENTKSKIFEHRKK